MAIGKVAVLPLVARAMRLVETPGRVAGEKVTEPSIAEVAVEDWEASNVLGGQTVCWTQGGAQA